MLLTSLYCLVLLTDRMITDANLLKTLDIMGKGTCLTYGYPSLAAT